MNRILNYFKGKKFKGSDQYSNCYYEESGIHPTRPRRTVVFYGRFGLESFNPKNYDKEKLPPLWHSWLCHKRDAPPTLNECLEDEERRVEVAKRGQIIEDNWKIRREELLNDPQYLFEKKKIEDEENNKK